MVDSLYAAQRLGLTESEAEMIYDLLITDIPLEPKEAAQALYSMDSYEALQHLDEAQSRIED